ncbi:MAG: hypothetical protein QG597_5259 [Actinomycetota bacterium]|nr:hypothetical protein [Actinomycetota bacterium]
MDALTNPSAKAFTDMVKPVDREQLVHRIITGLGIFGGLFALISTLVWMWPAGESEDPTPGNASVPAATLVTGFARDYVTTYLSAKAGDEDKLARFLTAKDLRLPPVGAAFTDTDVAFAKQVSETSDGVAVWTVTVSGVVNGNTSATAQRTFYRVPISVFNGAPRAAGLPMQVAAPAVGVDLRLGYRNSVSLESPLAQTAAGFVTAYLTGGTDFTRYVTADSRETPILPAPYMRVEVVSMGANVGSDGANATEAEVYVKAVARTKNYTLTSLAYPLSMRTVEGRWQVVSINAVPLLQSQPQAVSDDTPSTTQTTTAPPPAERG